MIKVRHLRKSYNSSRALHDFTLSVQEGEIVGLVGPNGAGKTTLIKILASLVRADSGEVLIGEKDVNIDPQGIRRIVGYMPDQMGLYQDMRVREFLEFFADAFRVPREQRRAAVDKGLERAGLEAKSQAFVEELSFGMKQRLLLAKTLLHEPRVLLLDEPATGLDPIARIDLRRRLKELNAAGITILLSSHILNDLEDICSRVALIADGKNAAGEHGQSVLEIKGPSRRLVYEIEVLDDPTEVGQKAEKAGAKLIEINEKRLRVELTGEDPSAASRLLSALVGSGAEIIRYDRADRTLEEQYSQIFGAKPR